jgi:hypothetical protein
MIANKKQKTEEKNSNSFWGWLFISYLSICWLYTSSIFIPALFFLWALNGWGISKFISHNYILGSDSVKNSFTVFGFFGVLGSLSLISVI